MKVVDLYQCQKCLTISPCQREYKVDGNIHFQFFSKCTCTGTDFIRTEKDILMPEYNEDKPSV